MTILIVGDEGVGPERSAGVPVATSAGTSVAHTTASDTMASDTTASAASTTWDQAADAFRDWRAGTPGAMDRLVATMTPVLWHVARASRLSEESAQDVVQTTWVALVQHAASVDDPQAVAAWLTMTARREAWRVSRRARTAVPVDHEVLGWVADDAATPEEAAVVHDGEDRLWACVQQLSERCRHLLRVVAFEQRPDYARIATDLGMAVGSIGPTRMRCLAKLRAALDAAGGGAP